MKHSTIIDLDDPGSSQVIMARAVLGSCHAGSRVLDIGCGSGSLGAALTDLGFLVTGVDDDADAVTVARNRLSRAVLTDLSEPTWTHELLRDDPAARFSAICMDEVLGRLSDPETVLRRAADLLDPDGVIVVSVANAAHGSARLALLQGHWPCPPQGSAGSPCPRPFTLETIADLMHHSGLGIRSLSATCREVLDTEVVDDGSLPETVVEWLRDQPETLDYQYVLTCAPSTEPGRTLPCVDRPLRPARPFDTHAERRHRAEREDLVRTRREHLLTSLEALRYDALTSRDALIGLEAQIGTLKKDVMDRDATLHEVRTELIETHARLAAAVADAQAAHRRLGMTAEGLTLRTVRKVSRAVKKA